MTTVPRGSRHAETWLPMMSRVYAGARASGGLARRLLWVERAAASSRPTRMCLRRCRRSEKGRASRLTALPHGERPRVLHPSAFPRNTSLPAAVPRDLVEGVPVVGVAESPQGRARHGDVGAGGR